MQNKKYKNIQSGFTLIELMVTIAVFVFLSIISLASFKQVDNSLVLQNVSHQIALIARKAQISGISVQGIDSGSGTLFPSYGINFDISRNSSFVLFADIGVRNNLLDVGCPSVECVQRYMLAQGYTIKELRGNQKTNTPGISLNRLDISFTRPNPDARIIGNSGISFSDAEVVVQSLSGKTKTVVIWKTGQISIE